MLRSPRRTSTRGERTADRSWEDARSACWSEATSGEHIALPCIAIGQADRDVDGDHCCIEGNRQIGERQKDLSGDTSGFSLFNESNPTGRTTIYSCDIGHERMIRGEYEALIDLRGLRLMRGSLPRRAMALVLEWASEHRDELMEDWELCQRMQPPKRIAPLK
jgi:hypothetical protein